MKIQRWNDILIFIKVIDNNSFTAAAEELGISKSAVSKHITRLEDSMQSQLLHRSTRNLSPTESGLALYESVSNMINQFEEAEQVVSFVSDAPRGELTVICPPCFSDLHLAKAISAFKQHYPDITLNIRTEAQLNDLISGAGDVAIHIGDLPSSNLKARRITVRPMRVCASPEYLKLHGTPKKPTDLVRHNCLHFSNNLNEDEWVFRYRKTSRRIKVAGNFTASSAQSLASAAVAGLGVVMLPGYMMIRDIQQGRLVSLLEDYCPLNIALYAVYPETRFVAPKVRVFIDFLVRHFDSKDYWRVNSHHKSLH